MLYFYILDFQGLDSIQVGASRSARRQSTTACEEKWPNAEKVQFLEIFGDGRMTGNIFEFNIQIPPDVTIVTAQMSGKFSKGGVSKNVSISLYEKLFECPYHEDGYAPLMSVAWETGDFNDNNWFNPPMLNDLLQYAVDKRKQLRNDHGDVSIALAFHVQYPRKAQNSNSNFEVFLRDLSLSLTYQPNTVCEYFTNFLYVCAFTKGCLTSPTFIM